MLDATFARPDLTTFCRLDELGLEVVGQRLEVLDTLQAAEVGDRIRVAAQTICQALIDAGLTAVIDAGPWPGNGLMLGDRGQRASVSGRDYRRKVCKHDFGDLPDMGG